MHLSGGQLFKLASLVVAVIIVVEVFIFFNLNRATIYDGLMSLDLIPKPEKLTELYFNDSANLPGSAKKNQVISFTFVIHNLEAADFQYIYAVSVNVNGTRQIVDSGNMVVKDNHYFVKNEKFNLMNVTGTQEIVVELTNKHQSIDFRTGE